MKVLAYYPIHYGSEYLEYSMQSIVQHVDEIIVLYSSEPTYGHKGLVQNPDTKEDIKKICGLFNAKFIDVTNKRITRENKHRDLAFSYARNKGYEIVLAVDYDETWQDVDKAIEKAKHGSSYQYAIHHAGWYHFWKNFEEINTDGFQPIRLFNLKNPKHTQETINEGKIYHFGYAISQKLMEYKISVHGHKSEIPKNWMDQKWVNYKKGETTHLHPASQDVWIETQPFDKTKLPKFMRKHPFYE